MPLHAMPLVCEASVSSTDDTEASHTDQWHHNSSLYRHPLCIDRPLKFSVVASHGEFLFRSGLFFVEIRGMIKMLFGNILSPTLKHTKVFFAAIELNWT